MSKGGGGAAINLARGGGRGVNGINHVLGKV